MKRQRADDKRYESENQRLQGPFGLRRRSLDRRVPKVQRLESSAQGEKYAWKVKTGLNAATGFGAEGAP